MDHSNRNNKNSIVIEEEKECIVLSDCDEHDCTILSDSEVINVDFSQFVIKEEKKTIGSKSVLNRNNECAVLLVDNNECESNFAPDNPKYQNCDINLVSTCNKLNAKAQLEALRQQLYKIKENTARKRKHPDYITLSDSDDSVILLE